MSKTINSHEKCMFLCMGKIPDFESCVGKFPWFFRSKTVLYIGYVVEYTSYIYHEFCACHNQLDGVIICMGDSVLAIWILQFFIKI